MNFAQQLKTLNPTLYDIHIFIIDAKKLGYGEIELTIKSHDYVSKIVEMRAIKPDKKKLAKRLMKKVMVLPEKIDDKT